MALLFFSQPRSGKSEYSGTWIFTFEKIVPFSKPGIELKKPSFSKALRSIASLWSAVAHRGVGSSRVEMTPKGMFSMGNGVDWEAIVSSNDFAYLDSVRETVELLSAHLPRKLNWWLEKSQWGS